MTLTLDCWIDGHARFSPGKSAICSAQGDYSYRELAVEIGRTARVLRETLGLRHGARIGFYGANNAEQLILMFACARLGVILVPLNWRLSGRELRYIVDDCALSAMFYDPVQSGDLDEILANLPNCQRIPIGAVENRGQTIAELRSALLPEQPANKKPTDTQTSDPLLIVYTSGTTGRPKGAVLSQQAIICNAMMSWHAHEMGARDHVLGFLPLFHVGGLNIQIIPALLCGATVTLHGNFQPDQVMAAIAKNSVTLMLVVPTVLRALLAIDHWAGADLTSLRAIAIGSTDVPVELIEAVHHRGVPVVQIYGATETGPLAIHQTIGLAHDTVGSIGRCGLHCDVRLVDRDGIDVAPGTDGEIWVRGDNILARYWNDQDADAASIVGDWFKTGDVAMQDADGNYWFRDRIQNVIISGGENIYPAELERILRELRGVGDVCVVGKADVRWGEVPVAVIERREDDLLSETVLAALDGRLARFKHPRAIIFVDELPRNALGKIEVAAVRDKVIKLAGGS